MCSITPPADGPVTAASVSAAIAHVEELIASIAGALAEPGRLDRGSLHPDEAARLVTALLAVADRGTASAVELAGHVMATSGTLIAGTYASPSRWLQVEAGLAPSSAKALLARARDLREHSGPVRDAWLAGEVSGDAVRVLTAGVTGALKPLSAPREEKSRLREEAVEILLPVARAGTVGDLARAVGRLRLLVDSSGAEQAALEAYDDQSLECVRVGDLARITAWLTPENAAAAMTVIDQHARRIADRDPEVVHDPACALSAPAPAADPVGEASRTDRLWCTCGGAAAAGATSKDRWSHLMAVAFAEHMTEQLDDGRVGSHHGVAPHVSVQITLEQLRAGLGGELAMPGNDEPVLLSPETARRILCDASITPVVVEPLPAPGPDPEVDADADADPGADPGAGSDTDAAGADHLARLLLSTAVAVLHVGRAERTATPRQRRALEARDRHCVFPGCRAHPRRCQAHHVVAWEHAGATDLDNLALLCRRHHIAVHEGGWRVQRAPGTGPHETGCWTFAPPRRRP